MKKYVPMGRRETAPERFWRHVQKTDGCWLWTGSVNRLGYGRFRITTKTTAHRACYALFVGPIPDRMHVAHSCDNKRCVRPDHLSLATPSENTRQAYERGLAGGERMGSAKLTEADVREIRGRDEYIDALALEYGVSASTIHRIRAGKLWKYVA